MMSQPPIHTAPSAPAPAPVTIPRGSLTHRTGSVTNSVASPPMQQASPTEWMSPKEIETAPETGSAHMTEVEREMWRTHTVTQLKQMEQQKRREAEEKKEELRQLVGIRYRVLIETADSIEAMEQLASNITRVQLPNVIKTLASIESRSSLSIPPITESSRDLRFNIISYIANAPEMLWDQLQRHTLIHACHTYRQATQKCHEIQIILQQELPTLVYNRSTCDTTLSDTPPSDDSHILFTHSHFHLFLTQHIATLHQFPQLIIRACHHRLNVRNLSIGEYADALACIGIMTEEMRMQQILILFLESRAAWIQRLLTSTSHAIKTFPSHDPTPTLCHALTAITHTIRHTVMHTAALFGTSLGTGKVNSPYNVATICRDFIAKQSKEATETASDRFTGLSSSRLRSLCSDWFPRITNVITSELKSLLQHIRDGKKMGKIRDSILSVIVGEEDGQDEKEQVKQEQVEEKQKVHEDQDIDGDEDDQDEFRSPKPTPIPAPIITTDPTTARATKLATAQQIWNDTCITVLGTSISLWDDIFAPPMSSRFKEIIRDAFTHISLHDMMSHVMNGWNTNHYIRFDSMGKVKEEEKDIEMMDEDHDDVDVDVDEDEVAMSDSVSSTSSSHPSPSTRHDLHGLRESQVQHICDTFNTQLTSLCTDVKYITTCSYLDDPITSSSFTSLHRLITSELRPYVQRMCTEMVSRLVHTLRDRLTTLQTTILELTDVDETRMYVDQALLMGRVCQRLAIKSEAFHEIVRMETATAPTPSAGKRDSLTFSSTSTNYILDSLLATSRSAYRIWTRYIAASLSDEMIKGWNEWKRQWTMDDSLVATWEKRSTSAHALPIPSAASHHILHLLFTLTLEMYRVDGHDISQQVLSLMINDVTQAALTVYEARMDVVAQLSDQARLQWLFDIQYLFAVLRLPPSGIKNDIDVNQKDERTRLASLISTLESSIDPINYAVVRDALIAQVTLSLTRCTVLYGTLIRLNPYPITFQTSATDASTASSTTSASSASDAANILPLAPPSARHNALSATLYPVKQKAQDHYTATPAPTTTTTTTTGSTLPTVITLSSLGGSSSFSDLTTPTTAAASAASDLSLPSLSVSLRPDSTTPSSTPSSSFAFPSQSSFLDRVGLNQSSADQAARDLAEKGKDLADKTKALLGKFSIGLSQTFSKEQQGGT